MFSKPFFLGFVTVYGKIMPTAFLLFSSFLPFSDTSCTETRQLRFHSQAHQDQFVHLILLELLKQQDVGYYFEIGGGHPIEINNTYFFETNLGWHGVSVDVFDAYQNLWKSTRRNLLVIADATQTDFHHLLQSFPKTIDYLSLDIDCAYDDALKMIPFDEHVFKVITIEHDFYKHGDLYRIRERNILTSHGYFLLCPDVSSGGAIFEDWWVHPDAIPAGILNALKTLDLSSKEHDQIINTLYNFIKSR